MTEFRITFRNCHNMELNGRLKNCLCATWLWILIPVIACTVVTYVNAQTEKDEEEQVFELSPFFVEPEQGYQATATLAGTRIKTDLKDLASSVSVVTRQFLEDTGATDSQGLLTYTTNTEVAGLSGNFAGTGNVQGIDESRNLNAPHTVTRVRGLEAADNTRNFFLTDIPWDGYNVDRIDLQRGPNSILFGVGSPSGIVNATTIVPFFSNHTKFENRIAEYGSIRNTLDYNHVLVDDLLAFRVALLHEDEQFKQKPAFEEDERGFAAIILTPDIFGERVDTRINVNFEKGRIRSNRPRIIPPVDKITPWWSGLDQQTYNAAWSWAFNAQLGGGNFDRAVTNPDINEPWLSNYMNGISGGGPWFIFNNGDPDPTTVRQPQVQTRFGINEAGNIDRGIGSFVFARLQSVAGFNEYSRNAEADAIVMGRDNPYPSASRNFYKDYHLQDPGIFDFYNNLLDGENKREWSDFEAINASISQTYLDNRFGIEFVADYQEYENGGCSLLYWGSFIGIDLNTHTGMIPVRYPDATDGVVPDPATAIGGELNPNVGRAFVSGGPPIASSSGIIRDNLRLTAFAELRGSDFFNDDSLLAKLIGRSVFTGLLSRDERRSNEESWCIWAADEIYARSQGFSAHLGERPVSFAVYLSEDLGNVSNPYTLNLPRIESFVDPVGNYTVKIFDSHWNAPDVNPADPFILPITGGPSFQSENWENYVGLSNVPVTILNAGTGDRDQLVENALKQTEILDSYGISWQGYWWEGMTVSTFGWRHDTIESWGASGEADPDTGVRETDFDNPKIAGEFYASDSDTITWGVVQHTDRWLQDRLPLGTHFSLLYNRSENFRTENRVGYNGESLPNPSGESEDYGIALNMLEDRLSFKVTWYKTLIDNADVGSANPLGGFAPWEFEMAGTTTALASELYWNGELPGMSWLSNYGLVDEYLWGSPGWENAPFSDEAINHPSNQALFAAIADWYATMPDQSFFDAYGLPINVSKVQGSLEDHRAIVNNGYYDPYDINASASPSGGGRINGLDPTMTINQESRGVEFEIHYRHNRNWNITVNASRTKAIRKDLNPEFIEWIEHQYNRFQGPAGDLRLWWGGGPTIRDAFTNTIYTNYLFQMDANGQSAPEIRPWRLNVITNYGFDDGPLAGVNIGGAVRWQDDLIIGYRLHPEGTKLDVFNPIRGGSETNLDFWIGYARKLTDRMSWRVQINLRNIGKDYELIPVSVNPDGSMAAGRISEGMGWAITNSFSF